MAVKLKENSHSVNGCVWLTGNSKIATVADDGYLRVWDTIKSACIISQEGHKEKIADISAKGKETDKVITASWDRSFALWDLRQEKKYAHGTSKSILTSCCSSVVEEIIALGLDSGGVSLWDERGMDKVAELRGHSKTVTCVRISENGNILCSASMDKTAKIWDLRMRKTLLLLKGPTNTVSSCCFSPNGHYVGLASWDKKLRLYNIASGSYRGEGPFILPGHEGSVSSCAFSSDGGMLVSGGYDRLVNVYCSLDRPAPKPSLRGHDNWVNAVSINRTDDVIAACGKDGAVYLWCLTTCTSSWEQEQILRSKREVYCPMECFKCKRQSNKFHYQDIGESLCVFCRDESS